MISKPTDAVGRFTVAIDVPLKIGDITTINERKYVVTNVEIHKKWFRTTGWEYTIYPFDEIWKREQNGRK
jgi:hypothetical protein